MVADLQPPRQSNSESEPKVHSMAQKHSGVTSGLLKLLGNLPTKKRESSPSMPPPPVPLPRMVPGSSAALTQEYSADRGSRQSVGGETAPLSSPFAVASIRQTPALGALPVPIPFEQLMASGSVDSASMAVNSLDTLRNELIGKYYEETEGRIKELRTALDGGLAKARKAALDRVDELGAAMHRDMVALRQEMHAELEDLKRDVFSAVMSLSALNDKHAVAEARAREVASAITNTVNERLEQQTTGFNTAFNSLQSGLDEAITKKVTHYLHQAIQELIWQQQHAESQPQ